jgi:peptidoglycan/xylan/chitin deacetylase (PgdA/CDA1 family)
VNENHNPSAPHSINLLLYHQVGDTPHANTNLDCFCRTEDFCSQMEFLSNSSYKVISLSKATELISSQKPIDADYVVLTFDDGCERFYDITFPVLESFGFPSAIYPVANYLGKRATWGNVRTRELRILSKNQLVELAGLQVEIGAHTMDHVKLTTVSEDDAIAQVLESKNILEQLTGREIRSFAYPHGAYTEETIDIVKEAGFSNALTCVSRAAGAAESMYEIPRKYITYYDDLNAFKQKLL